MQVGERPDIGFAEKNDNPSPARGHSALWALAQTRRYFYAHEYLHKEWRRAHRRYARNHEYYSDWFEGELSSRAVAPIYTTALTNLVLDERGIHRPGDKGDTGVHGGVFRGWFRPCSFILQQKKDKIIELRYTTDARIPKCPDGELTMFGLSALNPNL